MRKDGRFLTSAVKALTENTLMVKVHIFCLDDG